MAKFMSNYLVPSYMSISEFCLFTGAFSSKMKHIRVFRYTGLIAIDIWNTNQFIEPIP
jgi:hypothetical protein